MLERQRVLALRTLILNLEISGKNDMVSCLLLIDEWTVEGRALYPHIGSGDLPATNEKSIHRRQFLAFREAESWSDGRVRVYPPMHGLANSRLFCGRRQRVPRRLIQSTRFYVGLAVRRRVIKAFKWNHLRQSWLLELRYQFCWTVGLVIGARLCGWSNLAKHFPDNGECQGQTFYFRSGMVGCASYGAILMLRVCESGLGMSVFFPFRFGHSPVYIP